MQAHQLLTSRDGHNNTVVLADPVAHHVIEYTDLPQDEMTKLDNLQVLVDLE